MYHYVIHNKPKFEGYNIEEEIFVTIHGGGMHIMRDADSS